jgi:putative NADH-flavin reductase
MRVVLIGATGKVGRPMVRELLARGHEVVAVARRPESLQSDFPGVEIRQGDIFDPEFVREVLGGAAVLISSVRMKDSAQKNRTVLELHRMLMRVVSAAGVRWIAMGGAGSLEVEPGVKVLDSDRFPVHRAPASGVSAEDLQAEGRSNADTLEMLRTSAPESLQWTFVSPPIEIVVDAPRTGVYRTARDELLLNEEGRSMISNADLSAAVVDEVERGAHVRQRLAVAY